MQGFDPDVRVILCMFIFMTEEKSFGAVKEDIEKKFPTVKKEDFLQHVQSLHADSDVGFSHEFDVSNWLYSDFYSEAREDTLFRLYLQICY